MDDETKKSILDAGVPLDIYTKGIVFLGPSNRSALRRQAEISSNIYKHKLPLPPSAFIELVVDRTTGKSKQDFRMTLDGDPGTGKSYTSTYLAGRYAMEAADRLGKDPTDFFTLENCALLEDTEKITTILDNASSQQAIVIDDAGVAADSRDFATTSSKNMGKIMQTCRTRRWFVIFNIPRLTHVDLRIRELVTAKANIYKSFHDGGFNLVKIHSSKITSRGYKKYEKNPRFILDGKKIDFFTSYSTDLLDPYKGMVKEYDEARDAAAERLIHMIAGEEHEANHPGPSKREIKEQEMMTKYFEKVKTMIEENASERAILKACPGLTLTYLSKIRANGGF
jgi:hypothetical protein